MVHSLQRKFCQFQRSTCQLDESAYEKKKLSQNPLFHHQRERGFLSFIKALMSTMSNQEVEKMVVDGASPTDASSNQVANEEGQAKAEDKAEDKKTDIEDFDEFSKELFNIKLWDDIMRDTKYRNFGGMIHPKKFEEYRRRCYCKSKIQARLWGRPAADRAKILYEEKKKKYW